MRPAKAQCAPNDRRRWAGWCQQAHTGNEGPWLKVAWMNPDRMRSVLIARKLRTASRDVRSVRGRPAGSSRRTRTDLVSLSDSALPGPPELGLGLRRCLGHVSATTVRASANEGDPSDRHPRSERQAPSASLRPYSGRNSELRKGRPVRLELGTLDCAQDYRLR